MHYKPNPLLTMFTLLYSVFKAYLHSNSSTCSSPNLNIKHPRNTFEKFQLPPPKKLLLTKHLHFILICSFVTQNDNHQISSYSSKSLSYPHCNKTVIQETLHGIYKSSFEFHNLEYFQSYLLLITTFFIFL